VRRSHTPTVMQVEMSSWKAEQSTDDIMFNVFIFVIMATALN